MGGSLEARRDDIVAMALKARIANETGRYLRVVPGFEAAVRGAAMTAVDTSVAMLRSAEVQRTREASLRGVLERAEAESAQARHRPVGRPERPIWGGGFPSPAAALAQWQSDSLVISPPTLSRG